MKIPIESYYLFGSGSVSIFGNFPSEWKKLPHEDAGHNGFWGVFVINIPDNEVPKNLNVVALCSPGGQKTIVRNGASTGKTVCGVRAE